MNLAFPALLVLLLVLPGLIFRYSYASGSWGESTPTSFRNVTDELAYGVVLAVGLHCIWTGLAKVFGYPVDFSTVLALLLGNFGQGNATYARDVEAVAQHVGAIATYFLTLCAAAWGLGYGMHHMVRKYKLDRRTKMFRFRNPWWYLLRGEVLEFVESDDEPRNVSGVYLSAVVDLGKASYLYRGIVDSFTFDKDGQLDTISLFLAHRRELENDRTPEATRPVGGAIPPDDRYYDIHGDRLILRYSQLKTLNLDYFVITPEESTMQGEPRSVT